MGVTPKGVNIDEGSGDEVATGGDISRVGDSDGTGVGIDVGISTTVGSAGGGDCAPFVVDCWVFFWMSTNSKTTITSAVIVAIIRSIVFIKLLLLPFNASTFNGV